jgi:hypothetical protein
MAGSGSLYGVMRVRNGPLALRGLLSRERRAKAEQNRGKISSKSEVGESRGGRRCCRRGRGGGVSRGRGPACRLCSTR